MKWEYSLLYSDNDAQLLTQINNAGASGWEVIQMYELHGYFKALLKRPLK